MKAIVFVPGDPTAGISSISLVIDLGIEPLDERDREDIRDTLQAAFAHIYDDGGVKVTLSSDAARGEYS